MISTSLRLRLALGLGLSLGAAGAASLPAAKPLTIPTISFEKYSLPNGLEVILHEDHRLPLVSVDLWYHVGPRNERPGRTGFAHLFEHMMFEGSEHVGEKAHIRYVEGVGATDVNGTTDFDRTNYFETLPSNQLEMGLWLESDRMGFLLETLDREKLTNQRDVVRNERRQGEGRPYDTSDEALIHLLFPKAHPYYGSVIGSHADIEAARLNDVRAFFHQYYTPNNATLSIAGDFDRAALKSLVDKYFGPIPTGPKIDKVQAETPPITQERRAVVTDTVQLPRIAVGWLSPQAFAAGDADADLLMTILGGGKSSRLYRKLVYESQVAQEVDCNQGSLAIQSMAICTVTARPGVKPEALEAAVDQEIEQVQSGGVKQEEIDRARNVTLARKVEGLQRLGGFGGVADMLNLYNQYVGDPGYLPQDIARYEAVSVASIQAIAKQCFSKQQRATVYTQIGKKVVDDVPRSPADTDANVKTTPPYPDSFEAAQNWRKTAPPAGPSPRLNLPVPTVLTLPNGLKIYLVEEHALPVVQATLLTLAGAEANPADKPGLAAFTARMLTQGTAHQSATEIADNSAQIGAEIRSNATDDDSFGSVSALSNNSDAAVYLLSDMVRYPAFKAEEVDRVRKERLAAIVQEEDQPFRSAQRLAWRVLFGDTAYGYPATGTPDAVKRTSREDLAQFWERHYGPQQSALVLVGDVTATQARELADKYFGSWKAAIELQPTTPPLPPSVPSRRIVIVDKPGAPQTALIAVGVGLARSTPDYAAVTVMNNVLGGLFASRINMNLREKNGYTYGAFSDYAFHRGTGPFYAGAQVRTDVTAPATRELFAELNRMVKEPPDEKELTLARDYALRSLPGQFDTARATANLIRELYIYDLPADYYRKLPAQFDSLTPAVVAEAVRKYVHPDNLIIVAVGDRAKIQSGLEGLHLGPIELRNASGDLVH